MANYRNNLQKRLNANSYTNSYLSFEEQDFGLQKMQTRLNAAGGMDQWTRMRQHKLKGLRKALLYSYQSAVVQKYNVQNDNLVNNIITIITLLQDKKELSENQILLLNNLQDEYDFLETDRSSISYINQLEDIVDNLNNSEPMFRCLINHDKLKVDYEDKIISIPFSEPPIGGEDPIDTNFHNGTVFKWVHGNKQEWTPDTYWIVYMQYSEETAYFRAEIRKADEQVEIVTIDQQGNEISTSYRGWMTGPNETSILWNVKKGVVWNDMNYTKLLYITKDEDTLAFFQRFDRVIINGKPWEIQAYNENYSTSKTAGTESGIIRVALKQTYTNTDQFIKETLQNAETQVEEDSTLEPYIDGPTSAKPYDIITFIAKNFNTQQTWSISNSTLAKIIQVSQDGKTIKVQILTGKSNKEGFYVKYGNDDNYQINVVIKSII